MIDGPAACWYAEDRCALRWPLIAWVLAGPAVLMATFILFGIIMTTSHWLIAVAPTAGVFLISVGFLYRNWPTAIRMDERGIRIGAVRSRGAAGRAPTVTHQSWRLFACPWPGVTGLEVVTDPARIRELRTSSRYYTLGNRWSKPRGMTRCMIGVLVPPFMRAALIIEVDIYQADSLGITVPATRAASFFPNEIGRPFRTRLEPEPSPVWVVPTRKPQQLRQAIGARGKSGNAPAA
jgi:hypothetical protein